MENNIDKSIEAWDMRNNPEEQEDENYLDYLEGVKIEKDIDRRMERE